MTTLDCNRPCGQLGPYTTTKRYKGRAVKVISVACNRPYGHDGSHLWSDGYRGRRYEWTPAGERVTHRADPKVRIPDGR